MEAIQAVRKLRKATDCRCMPLEVDQNERITHPQQIRTLRFDLSRHSKISSGDDCGKQQASAGGGDRNRRDLFSAKRKPFALLPAYVILPS